MRPLPSPSPDTGLLLLRIGIGLAFVAHGWPKLVGGVETWTKLGGTMSGLGIHFGAPVWGFLAAFTEAVGGVLLAVGLGTRAVSVALAFTMVVAVKMHLDAGDGFRGWSHAFEDGVVFVALVFMGAGRFSLDALLARRAAPDGPR